MSVWISDLTRSRRELLSTAGVVNISVMHSSAAADHSTKCIWSADEIIELELDSSSCLPMIAASASFRTRPAKFGKRITIASSALLASMRRRTNSSRPFKLVTTTFNSRCKSATCA